MRTPGRLQTSYFLFRNEKVRKKPSVLIARHIFDQRSYNRLAIYEVPTDHGANIPALLRTRGGTSISKNTLCLPKDSKCGKICMKKWQTNGPKMKLVVRRRDPRPHRTRLLFKDSRQNPITSKRTA